LLVTDADTLVSALRSRDDGVVVMGARAKDEETFAEVSGDDWEGSVRNAVYPPRTTDLVTGGTGGRIGAGLLATAGCKDLTPDAGAGLC
jgi:hypothetical protein